MEPSRLMITGILIGVLIFALKVSLGCGLAGLSRRQILCIASGYLTISILMGILIDALPREAFSGLLKTGVAFHAVAALVLVLLGIITAREWNHNHRDVSRKTFWALSLPCPACLAASFLSCSILSGLLDTASWKIGVIVGLTFFASIAIFSSALKRCRGAPTAIGSAMIFLGLFYILSMLLVPAYLDTRSTTFVPPALSAPETVSSYLVILCMVATGFIARRKGVSL